MAETRQDGQRNEPWVVLVALVLDLSDLEHDESDRQHPDGDLALQHRELVAQHEDLDMLGTIASTAHHQQVEYEPHKTVETGHAPILAAAEPRRSHQRETPDQRNRTDIRHPHANAHVAEHRGSSRGSARVITDHLQMSYTDVYRWCSNKSSGPHAGQNRGVRKGGVGDRRVGEVRIGEVRAREVRAGEVRAGKIRVREIRVGEVGVDQGRASK
jgi:hypothetical protein